MDTELLLHHYLKFRGAKFRSEVCNRVRIHSLHIEPGSKRSTARDVVLLHGIGSSGGHFVQVLFHLAAMGYRVHAPDLPGHGLSGDHPEKLTSHELFETTLAWMRSVAPKNFALIGNSMGGALAWRFAGLEPHRVSKLILLSPAVGFDSHETWETFRLSLAMPDRAAAKSFLDRIAARPSLFSSFMVPSIFRNMNRRAVRDILEHTRYADLEDQHKIKDVQVPTLVVWGNQDDLLPRSNLEWIKRTIPKQVEVMEPEGVGHCPQLDSPRWLQGVLKRALD